MQHTNLHYLKVKKKYLEFLKSQEVLSEPFRDKLGQLNNFYLPLSEFIFKNYSRNKKTNFSKILIPKFDKSIDDRLPKKKMAKSRKKTRYSYI